MIKCLRLWTKDIDFNYNITTIHNGKAERTANNFADSRLATTGKALAANGKNLPEGP
ncbi:MAG: hypothetical protein H0Z30_01615 [Candidatus Marinimicrobia bacterium]|nr:hypothetical protein [Candidatus Neomarinimicrobiota bacterium]